MLLTIAILPLISSFLTIFLHLNFLASTVLYFAPPALYLLLKQKRQLKKILIFSSLISLPFTFILDYLITKDLGWYIVKSIFPVRLFHQVAIEQFFWGFLYTVLVVSFYEFFLDKKDKKRVIPLSPDMKIFSRFIYAFLIVFIGIAAIFPDILYLKYAYLILGLFLGVIPFILFLSKFPIFIKRFTTVIFFFGYFTMLNEYVSLKLGHWTFPGTHFIGTLSFFGYTIPYEEAIFYFVLTAPILLAYYEFLDDDRK